jgi:hypothetical protein
VKVQPPTAKWNPDYPEPLLRCVEWELIRAANRKEVSRRFVKAVLRRMREEPEARCTFTLPTKLQAQDKAWLKYDKCQDARLGRRVKRQLELVTPWWIFAQYCFILREEL